MPVVFTNSGTMRPRHKTDFYLTPQWAARVGVMLGMTSPPESVLDMGSGTGSFGIAVKSIFPKAYVVGYEVDPDLANQDTASDIVYVEDILTSTVKPEYDLVISNPPFKHALEFIKLGRKFIKPRIDSRMVILTRLSFLASQKRYSLFTKEFVPQSVHVFSQRPSWTGNRKTYPDDYCYIVWGYESASMTTMHWISPEECVK